MTPQERLAQIKELHIRDNSLIGEYDIQWLIFRIEELEIKLQYASDFMLRNSGSSLEEWLMDVKEQEEMDALIEKEIEGKSDEVEAKITTQDALQTLVEINGFTAEELESLPRYHMDANIVVKLNREPTPSEKEEK